MAHEIIEAVEPSQRQVAAVDTTPGALLRLAVQQGADIAQLERLMALQERWEATEARKAFVTAMTAFKAEPLVIYKTKQVAFNDTKYKHAELSDVTDVVVPAMARHGLSHRWDVQQDGPKITVNCIVTHALGHSERVMMESQPDSSGKKNAIQAVASAVSYLQRYTLLAVTGMATTGQDDDGQGGKSPEEIARDEAQAKRGAELRRMTSDMEALFSEGREFDALRIWQNPKHWATDLGEANEERIYAWSELKGNSKLRSFLKANDQRSQA